MKKITKKDQRAIALAGARNYAAADRSDPFAFARMMTHIDNGIVSFGLKDGDAIYSAEPYKETRHLPITVVNGKEIGGEAYTVTCYKTMRRP